MDILLVTIALFDGVLIARFSDDIRKSLTKSSQGRKWVSFWRVVESTKGCIGASQISGEFIFEDLIFSPSPALELIFNFLVVLQKDFGVFLISGDIVMIPLGLLIIVDKVMSWNLQR